MQKRLVELLANATTDAQLEQDLRQPKTVFFLHLLGLDTTGHGFRPHSKEYMNNIHTVDTIVKSAESAIENFYGNDGRTAYLFTADHGMSVMGNHGDGHPDNTRTPLIAWGSGFRSPVSSAASPAPAYSGIPTLPQSYLAPFGLDETLRVDAEQADVASLMSAVLGLGWPVNGVGVVPDVKTPLSGENSGYLDLGEGDERKKNLAELGLVNAKVICEQYRVKDALKEKHSLLYQYFPLLSAPVTPQNAFAYMGQQTIRNVSNTSPVDGQTVFQAPSEDQKPNVTPGGTSPQSLMEYRLALVRELIDEGSYERARHESYELIKDGLEGLKYLHTYDRTLLTILITLAYTGWITYVFIYIANSSSPPQAIHPALAYAMRIVLFGAWSIFFAQKNPWTYGLYVVFPVFFWGSAVQGWMDWRDRKSVV